MKTKLLFLLVALLFSSLNAQSNILIGQKFSSNIGSICEETPEPDPCAGLQVYLILDFTKKKGFNHRKRDI